MFESFQGEMTRVRINIKLDRVMGGVQKKVELPLKLLSVGDYSNGKAEGTLSEREKININKNSFNSVLADLNPEVNRTVKNILVNDGFEENVKLAFQQTIKSAEFKWYKINDADQEVKYFIHFDSWKERAIA